MGGATPASSARGRDPARDPQRTRVSTLALGQPRDDDSCGQKQRKKVGSRGNAPRLPPPAPPPSGGGHVRPVPVPRPPQERPVRVDARRERARARARTAPAIKRDGFGRRATRARTRLVEHVGAGLGLPARARGRALAGRHGNTPALLRPRKTTRSVICKSHRTRSSSLRVERSRRCTPRRRRTRRAGSRPSSGARRSRRGGGAGFCRGAAATPRALATTRLDAATAGSGRDRADPESADARGRASREAADRRISQTPHVVTHNPATVAGGCFGDARPGGARRLARLLKEDEETAVVAWTRRNALRIVLSQRCASLKGDWGGSSDACFPWNTTSFPARGWAGAAARAYGVERGAGAGEEGARRHDRGWVRGRATPREQPPIVRSDSIEPRDRPRDHRRDTAGAASRPSRATAAPPRRSTTRTSPPRPRKSSPTC